tara:strand:- start:54 stop:344 length:291 start_codon:yes stop_codon:yes gene_type:complete
MKKTKKESNESKNQKRRKEEGKHKNRSRWRRNSSLEGLSFLCFVPFVETTKRQTFAFSNTQQQQQQQQQHAHKKHTTRARLLFSSLKQKRRAEISA